MRRSRLKILPTRCVSTLGFILIMLACPTIAEVSTGLQDIDESDQPDSYLHPSVSQILLDGLEVCQMETGRMHQILPSDQSADNLGTELKERIKLNQNTTKILQKTLPKMFSDAISLGRVQIQDCEDSRKKQQDGTRRRNNMRISNNARRRVTADREVTCQSLRNTEDATISRRRERRNVDESSRSTTLRGGRRNANFPHRKAISERRNVMIRTESVEGSPAPLTKEKMHASERRSSRDNFSSSRENRRGDLLEERRNTNTPHRKTDGRNVDISRESVERLRITRMIERTYDSKRKSNLDAQLRSEESRAISEKRRTSRFMSSDERVAVGLSRKSAKLAEEQKTFDQRRHKDGLSRNGENSRFASIKTKTDNYANHKTAVERRFVSLSWRSMERLSESRTRERGSNPASRSSLHEASNHERGTRVVHLEEERVTNVPRLNSFSERTTYPQRESVGRLTKSRTMEQRSTFEGSNDNLDKQRKRNERARRANLKENRGTNTPSQKKVSERGLSVQRATPKMRLSESRAIGKRTNFERMYNPFNHFHIRENGVAARSVVRKADYSPIIKDSAEMLTVDLDRDSMKIFSKSGEKERRNANERRNNLYKLSRNKQRTDMATLEVMITSRLARREVLSEKRIADLRLESSARIAKTAAIVRKSSSTRNIGLDNTSDNREPSEVRSFTKSHRERTSERRIDISRVPLVITPSRRTNMLTPTIKLSSNVDELSVNREKSSVEERRASHFSNIKLSVEKRDTEFRKESMRSSPDSRSRIKHSERRNILRELNLSRERACIDESRANRKASVQRKKVDLESVDRLLNSQTRERRSTLERRNHLNRLPHGRALSEMRRTTDVSHRKESPDKIIESHTLERGSPTERSCHLNEYSRSRGSSKDRMTASSLHHKVTAERIIPHHKGETVVNLATSRTHEPRLTYGRRNFVDRIFRDATPLEEWLTTNSFSRKVSSERRFIHFSRHSVENLIEYRTARRRSAYERQSNLEELSRSRDRRRTGPLKERILVRISIRKELEDRSRTDLTRELTERLSKLRTKERISRQRWDLEDVSRNRERLSITLSEPKKGTSISLHRASAETSFTNIFQDYVSSLTNSRVRSERSASGRRVNLDKLRNDRQTADSASLDGRWAANFSRRKPFSEIRILHRGRTSVSRSVESTRQKSVSDRLDDVHEYSLNINEFYKNFDINRNTHNDRRVVLYPNSEIKRESRPFAVISTSNGRMYRKSHNLPFRASARSFANRKQDSVRIISAPLINEANARLESHALKPTPDRGIEIRHTRSERGERLIDATNRHIVPTSRSSRNTLAGSPTIKPRRLSERRKISSATTRVSLAMSGPGTITSIGHRKTFAGRKADDMVREFRTRFTESLTRKIRSVTVSAHDSYELPHITEAHVDAGKAMTIANGTVLNCVMDNTLGRYNEERLTEFKYKAPSSFSSHCGALNELTCGIEILSSVLYREINIARKPTFSERSSIDVIRNSRIRSTESRRKELVNVSRKSMSLSKPSSARMTKSTVAAFRLASAARGSDRQSRVMRRKLDEHKETVPISSNGCFNALDLTRTPNTTPYKLKNTADHGYQKWASMKNGGIFVGIKTLMLPSRKRQVNLSEKSSDHRLVGVESSAKEISDGRLICDKSSLSIAGACKKTLHVEKGYEKVSQTTQHGNSTIISWNLEDTKDFQKSAKIYNWDSISKHFKNPVRMLEQLISLKRYNNENLYSISIGGSVAALLISNSMK